MSASFRQDHRRVIVDPYLYGERKRFQRITPLPGYNIKVKEEEDEKAKACDEGDEGESYKVVVRHEEGLQYPDATPHRVARRWGDDGGQGTGSFASLNLAQKTFSQTWPDREARRRPTEAEVQLNRRVVLECEDNLLIMPYQAFGYSLDKRTWGTFSHLAIAKLVLKVSEKPSISTASLQSRPTSRCLKMLSWMSKRRMY